MGWKMIPVLALATALAGFTASPALARSGHGGGGHSSSRGGHSYSNGRSYGGGHSYRGGDHDYGGGYRGGRDWDRHDHWRHDGDGWGGSSFYLDIGPSYPYYAPYLYPPPPYPYGDPYYYDPYW